MGTQVGRKTEKKRKRKRKGKEKERKERKKERKERKKGKKRKKKGRGDGSRPWPVVAGGGRRWPEKATRLQAQVKNGVQV